MTKVVVGACVAAKWLAPEPGSAAAEALLDEEPVAPDLLYAEVASILRKKTMRGEMTTDAADLAVRWLLQMPIEIHHGAGLFVESVALAQRLQHPAYDCFYLAAAVHAGCRLVTADRRLYERCGRGGAGPLRKRVESLAAS